MRLRALSIALVGVVAPAVLTASSAAGAAQAQPLEKVVLQLAREHRFESAGFYAAIEQGYYRQAGLDVELRLPGPGEDPVEAVHAGKARYGVAGADLVLERSQGRDVRALAAIFQHSPLVLLARRDAGIESLHDLAGKRVMLERGAAALRAYLLAEGIPAARLELVEHTFAIADLVDGHVEAMSADSTDAPYVLERAGIEYLTFTPRSGGIDFYGNTLFTTGSEIDAHPERVRAFVEASLRGWRHALEHPMEIVDRIRSDYSDRYEPERLLFEARRIRRLIAPDLVELGSMNPGRWRYIADVYASLGLMPHGFDVDGFLWRPGARKERDSALLAAGLALVLVTAIVLVGWRFFRLNRALQQVVDEREQAEQDLHASEQRHRLLVEAAPFPVVISRQRDGLLRFVNPAAADMLGLDPQSSAEHHAPEFYAQQSERRRLLAMIDAQGSVNHFETRLRSLEGQEFWVDTSATRFDYEGESCIFVAFSDITERKTMEQNLRQIADTDALTGAASRRRFLQVLESEIAVRSRYGRPACVMVLDIDHFKQVNDTHGHPAGDQALAHFALNVESILRTPDTLGRLGGEEFAILLRETRLDEAREAAERVRSRVEGTAVPGLSERVTLTVSIGVTEIQGDDTVASALERVDQLLYAAKEAGRNRVCDG